jgi:hypothetical protein
MNRRAAVFMLLCLPGIVAAEVPLKAYRSDAGKFRVQFPGGTPRQTSVIGRDGVKVQSFEVHVPDGSYVVICHDTASPTDAADKALESEANEILAGLVGTRTSLASASLGKHPGIDYAADVTRPRPLMLRGRSYLVGTRVYSALLIGTPEFVGTERATAFLNSFKVD